MRAAYYDRTGEAQDVLRIGELPDPLPGLGEVRVRIMCSGVNPSDVKQRSGWTPAHRPGRIVPHHDGAGLIDAVGAGVSPDRIGERVWLFEAGRANGTFGTAATLVVIPDHQAVPLPDTASFLIGACLGVPAMTAHACMLGDGPVAGQTVLVAGGAGGVGRFAVQLARWAGARVLATAGTPEQAAVAIAAGAERAMLYRDPDLLEQLREAAPAGVDRIVDVALATNIVADVGIARHGATIVSYASAGDTGTGIVIPARQILGKALTLRWVHVYSLSPGEKSSAIADITTALAHEALSVPPIDVFPLDAVAFAHDRVGIGGAGRKCVIDVAKDFDHHGTPA